MSDKDYTRRQFLDASLKAAGAAAFVPQFALGAGPAEKDKPATAASPASRKAARDDSAAEKLGWRLSMCSYTLRAMTFIEAVDATAALGLKYLDIHPSMTLSKDSKAKTSHALTDELRQQMKKKLQDAGLRAGSYGVVGVPAKEEDARKVLAFAKEMGVFAVNCEAKPDQLAALDKLAEEFGVSIALHNHPKPATYWDADTVLKAVEGRSKRIGACADTGHWKRSGVEPVECLKKLKGRVVSLHFKDVIEAGKGWQDVPWGTGKGDVKGLLAELKNQGFQGVFGIEYEHGRGQELLDDVAKCIRFFDQTAADLK